MFAGIEENRLKTGKHKVKVKYFPGACTDDMYDYIKPLLWKLPNYIILHIGTKDALIIHQGKPLQKTLNWKRIYTEGITEMQNHCFNTD